MFNAVRRGSSSLRISAASCSFPASWIRPSVSRLPFQKLPQPPRLLLPRSFSQYAPLKQRTAEATAIEEDIEEEANAQRPLSDAAIDEATKHGPVTRFKELGERKMVCDTVVKTLIDDMKLETMTQVQSLTINETLKGGDV